MRALSEILEKKNYTSSAVKKQNGTYYLLAEIIFIFLITLSALGEWKKINAVAAGLPKALTVGVILMAFVFLVIAPDFKRAKELWGPAAMYMLLILMLLLWSIVIWVLKFSGFSSMLRGCSKMVFQSIAVLSAVAAVYLFGKKAALYFTVSLLLTNGLIMLFEMPNYGVAESIRSVITCIVTFGDASDYARSLEIHDLTFVFGQLIIYYAAFYEGDGEKDRRNKWVCLILCTFAFLVGMKRIAVPAVFFFTLLALLLRNRKKLAGFFVAAGVLWIIFFLLFIYGVRNGYVTEICSRFGIDMMGRDYLWRLTNDYYSFSPLYMGRGFEFVDTVVKQWYNDGLIKKAYMFHNDILKVFVEMGFPGFMLWSGIQYILYPVFFTKYAGQRAALLYFAELSYMTVTYLTDNTAFYFWSTLGLKLIVLCYAYSEREKRKPTAGKWRPPTKDEVIAAMGRY